MPSARNPRLHGLMTAMREIYGEPIRDLLFDDSYSILRYIDKKIITDSKESYDDWKLRTSRETIDTDLP